MTKNISCGGCTVCCRVMGVDDIDKAPGVMCVHCAEGVGCRIYETRPRACMDFQCEWLKAAMPESLRPDLSHVLLVGTDDHMLIAKIDPAYPEAHKHDHAMAALLRMTAQSGTVVIIMLGEQLIEIHYSSSALTTLPDVELRELLQSVERQILEDGPTT